MLNRSKRVFFDIAEVFPQTLFYPVKAKHNTSTAIQMGAWLFCGSVLRKGGVYAVLSYIKTKRT
jgi:hypothetical protein